MIPNDEQLLVIKRYLTEHLKYRETKDEMFDHILTAIENTPEGTSFGVAMNKVIGDIGGLQGIVMLEKAAKRSAIKGLLKKYLETFKQICLSPIIVVIAALAFGEYHLLNSNVGWYRLFTMVLLLNVPAWAIKRQVLAARNLVNVKNDAFKTMFTIARYLPAAVILLSVVSLHFFPANIFDSVMLYVVTGVFFTTMLQAAALYKLTRQEFRVKIADV